MTFSFVQLDQLSASNKDEVVDVIGICRSAKDVATITSKAGKELTKRDITIADQRYLSSDLFYSLYWIKLQLKQYKVHNYVLYTITIAV